MVQPGDNKTKTQLQTTCSRILLLTVCQDPSSRLLPLRHTSNHHYSAPHPARQVHELTVGSPFGRQELGLVWK